MQLLSFVIPCYRSEKTIELVINEIIATVNQKPDYDYEIIAVNDCSPDNVYDVLKKVADDNKKVKVINFAKNMGKHAAVLAGFSACKGDFVVTLDDDCQSPTYNVWKLIELLENDECDVASSEYIEKKESRFKFWGSNLNLKMTELLLDKPKGLRLENLLVLKSFVVKEMIKYSCPYPYLEGLIFRVTNRVKTVKMEQRERGDSNATGFTFKKSLSLLLNGLTSFSVKPLRLATVCGMVFAIIGFVYGLYVIFRRIVRPEILVGYSSLMAVLVFVSGIIMMMLGLIGEYLGRIFICINESPQYVIKDTINLE